MFDLSGETSQRLAPFSEFGYEQISDGNKPFHCGAWVGVKRAQKLNLASMHAREP
jgi:hypothetical protein